jgi:multidrug efflux system membrane fusion protein
MVTIPMIGYIAKLGSNRAKPVIASSISQCRALSSSGLTPRAPTVPAQTVQDGPTGQYAYVIKEDGTVERRPVEVAAVQDGVAVIGKGLSVGDRVVVEGQYRLTNGVRVKVEAKPAGAAG